MGTLQGFVKDHAVTEATVFTDESTARESPPFNHDYVNRSLIEYVQIGMHTTDIGSLGTML